MVVAIKPTPVSATVWGLLEALSDTVKVAVRVPAAEGQNLTLMLQEAPAATGSFISHKKANVKSPGAFPPEMAMLLMVRGTVCLFVSVTTLEELLPLMGVLPKTIVAGVRVTVPWANDGLTLTSSDSNSRAPTKNVLVLCLMDRELE
jgi:hypothetical protein